MATKKRSSSEKGHKAEVKQLRSRLEKAEARGDKWKARAGRYQEDAAELRAELKKASKQLRKARQVEPATESNAQPEPPPSNGAPDGAQPDASWTVVRLRDEARSRGVAGVTTKNKTQLLALLRAE